MASLLGRQLFWLSNISAELRPDVEYEGLPVVVAKEERCESIEWNCVSQKISCYGAQDTSVYQSSASI